MTSKFSFLKFLEAISILVGTMVGAGVFALPFVVSKVGFWPAIIIMAGIALAMLIIYLLLAEICLSSKDLHHYTGYAEKYLGKRGKYLMLAIILFSLHAPLVAYMIGEGNVISSLFGINPFWASLIFWFIGSTLVFFGLKLVEKLEFFFSAIFILLIIGIVLYIAKDFSWLNLSLSNWKEIFLPYGVFLFAFGGGSAIPLMRQALKGNEDHLKISIITAVGIVFVLYFLFAFAVAGVLGIATTPIASIGLGQKYGSIILIVANFFAMFAMFTGFLSIGTSLKTLYQNDWNLSKNLSWLIAVCVPLVIFLAGIRNFIQMMDLAGAFASGLEGIMLIGVFIAMRKLIKTDRESEIKFKHYKIVSTILIAMFLLGMFYTAYNL